MSKQGGMWPPEALLDAIRREDDFMIVGHIDPDPDSTGSVLAMQRLLLALGKNTVVVTPDPLPAHVQFLPGSEDMLLPDQVTSESWRHLIVLDCGTERIGNAQPFVERAGIIVNIDHHGTNPGTGHFNWIDTQFAATTQMVYTLFDAFEVGIDADAATLLYTGLAGDTGTFRFSNTDSHVLRMAAHLVEAGADPTRISQNLYESHSLAYLRLVAKMLDTVKTAFDERVVYARLTESMRQQAGMQAGEGGGLIQYLRMVKSAEVVFLLEEVGETEVKVQFRSRSAVDVSRLAHALGGGGHARAAGCRLTATLDEAETTVLSHIGAVLATT